jgi:hypothetical protein
VGLSLGGVVVVAKTLWTCWASKRHAMLVETKVEKGGQPVGQWETVWLDGGRAWMAGAAWRGTADGAIGSLGTLRGAVGKMGGTGTLRGGAVARVSLGVTRGGTGTLRTGVGIRGSFGAGRGGAGGANRSANRRSLANSLAARGAKADPGEGWRRHWRIS